MTLSVTTNHLLWLLKKDEGGPLQYLLIFFVMGLFSIDKLRRLSGILLYISKTTKKPSVSPKFPVFPMHGLSFKATRSKLCMQPPFMRALVLGRPLRPPRPSADMCYFGCQKIIEGRIEVVTEVQSYLATSCLYHCKAG